MAVIQTSASFYRGDYNPLGACVGYESGNGTASVGRFKFRTDKQGATKLSFETSSLYLAHSASGDENAYDRVAELRFIITAEATGYENYYGGAGYSCGYEYGKKLYGETDVELLPDTNYYLWIFPNYVYYAVFGINNVTVTTEGQYGTPSTISAADGYVGDTIPITLTRGLSSMVHTVTVECAGVTETLISESETYPTTSWNPSLEKYGPLITKADYAEAVITAETFLNGNSLGKTNKTIKAKIKPTQLLPQTHEGWVTVRPYNTGAAEGFSCYVSGYSRAQAVFDESKIDLSGTMGGTIAGFSIAVLGTKVNAAPYITGVLKEAATITCEITDSRGRTIKETIDVNPLAYANPSMSNVSVYRCDANGNESEDYKYFSATATAVYSPLGGENGYSMRCCFKAIKGEYGAWTSMVSGNKTVISGTDADLSYEVKIEITDELGNSATITRQLPTRIPNLFPISK